MVTATSTLLVALILEIKYQFLHYFIEDSASHMRFFLSATSHMRLNAFNLC